MRSYPLSKSAVEAAAKRLHEVHPIVHDEGVIFSFDWGSEEYRGIAIEILRAALEAWNLSGDQHEAAKSQLKIGFDGVNTLWVEDISVGNAILAAVNTEDHYP